MTRLLKQKGDIKSKILNILLIITTQSFAVVLINIKSYTIVGKIDIQLILVSIGFAIMHIFLNYKTIKYGLFNSIFFKKQYIIVSVINLLRSLTITILEELTYRVFMISILLIDFSQLSTILISSSLFVLHHTMIRMNRVTARYITELVLFSILTSYIYIKTSSIVMCIITHLLFNIVILFDEGIQIIKEILRSKHAKRILCTTRSNFKV